MLERLSFKNIGPSPEMALKFGDRLNLLTGDNGLGKTFVLDAAWWALTRTWADGKQLEPPVRATLKPVISYLIHGVAGPTSEITCNYDLGVGKWRFNQGRKPNPGLVVYARVDGGFSVWDPARNYWRATDRSPEEDRRKPSSFQFTRRQVWSGLWRSEEAEKKRLTDDILCRGLVEDLVTWWQQKGVERDLFQDLLADLSPKDPLVLSDPVSAGRGLVKVPTLKASYSTEPIRLTEASAGVRRIVSLAYMLVWSWLTHQEEVKAFPSHTTRAKRLILLFDEIETHLHPEWQRRVLPSLLKAIESRLLKGAGIPVQIIGTTHAPLVLASMETQFDVKTDRLFNFEQKNDKHIEVEVVKWAKFGDASGWLTSPAFDMGSGYSNEAESAMKAADDLMAGYLDELPETLATAEAIHAELNRTLNVSDPYWGFWLSFYEGQKSTAANGRNLKEANG